MTFSILQEVLMPVSFGALLCLMLLYWGQAALFSYTKYTKLTTVLFSFSFFLLTTLIILRWLDSGHFPLSNLYESLLFLSWSFLGIQLVAQLTLIRGVNAPALVVYGKPFDFAHRPVPNLRFGVLAKGEQLAWPPKAGNGSTRRAESARPHSAKITLAQPALVRQTSERGLARKASMLETPLSPTGQCSPKMTAPAARLWRARQTEGLAQTGTSTSLSNFFDAAPEADRLITSDIEHPPRPVVADFALRELSQRQLLHLLGVITSPMALLTYGFAFLKLPREMQKVTALVPALQSNWLMMHVTIMILSYAALLCGSIFSMVFLLLTSLNTSSPADSAVLLQTVTGTRPAVGAGPTRNAQTPRTRAQQELGLARKALLTEGEHSPACVKPSERRAAGAVAHSKSRPIGPCSPKVTAPAAGCSPSVSKSTGALYTAGRQHSSLGVDKALPAAAYLKVEPSAGVILGPTWPELPKICFSDRLELHDWARCKSFSFARAQTRLDRAAGWTLDVAAAKSNLLQELRRLLAFGDRAGGRHAKPKVWHRPATSTTRFTQAGSALNRQDLELLNNKGQFVGGGLTDLLPERPAPGARLWRPRRRPARQTEGLAQAGSGLSRRDLGVTELEENLEKKSSYLDLAERLDNYSYRVLALGFPLLTVGILSGAVWANEAWGSYWSWDPKETWALITWLVFAIYLHARILKGWTGRKPAMIATFGFFVVWFCYLGVNLLGTGLHSYGWFSN